MRTEGLSRKRLPRCRRCRGMSREAGSYCSPIARWTCETRESIAEAVRDRHRGRSFLRGAGPFPPGLGWGDPKSKGRSRKPSTAVGFDVVEKEAAAVAGFAHDVGTPSNSI